MSTFKQRIMGCGNPDARSPHYLRRLIKVVVAEASAQTPEDRTRHFMIGVEHYWHGYVEDMYETTASPESIRTAFEASSGWVGLKVHKLEEFAKVTDE